jgi:intracellular septation protein A
MTDRPSTAVAVEGAASTVRLPGLRSTAGHAARQQIDGVILPLVLFYGGLQLLGLTGAILAALAWGYAALVVRLVTGRTVPGVLIITLVTLTVRSFVSLATGSVFMYFLQPTLGTLLVAVAFLVSVPLGRPLAQRLAGDFLVLPEAIGTAPWVRQFFMRISLLWAFVFLANFAVTLWLLVTQALETFLILRTVVSIGLNGSAVAASILLFVSMARWHDLRVAIGSRVFGGRPRPAKAA